MPFLCQSGINIFRKQNITFCLGLLLRTQFMMIKLFAGAEQPLAESFLKMMLLFILVLGNAPFEFNRANLF